MDLKIGEKMDSEKIFTQKKEKIEKVGGQKQQKMN